MANITLHIDATHNWPKAAAFLASEGVQSAFLLNANPDQIQYALDHTSGIVVVRVYDPFGERRNIGDNFEKDILLRHNQGDFVAWLNQQDLSRFKGNKRVRFILGWNECHYVDAAYQRKQNTAMIEVSKALIQAGYGVAMFGMAADKTIQSEDCDNGVWDETIDFAIQNSEWVHIDLHEYEVGRLASQHLKAYPVGYPRSIEDPNAMRQENWGAIDYSVKRNGNWHIGRVSWLLNRSREKFGKDFPWARGEFGWDYKDDGSLRAYIPEYMGRYGKPQGLPSLRPLFCKLMNNVNLSDKELCEEAYKDLAWMVSFDPPSCLSNALFAHNPQRDHVNFNVSMLPFEHLYTLLGQQKAQDIPMPTTPSDTLIPMRAKSTASATNIRTEATATSAKLGTIPSAFVDVMVSDNWNADPAPEWVKLRYLDKLGYSSKAFLEIEARPIVIPPPVDPQPELYAFQFYGYTKHVTKAQLELLQDVLPDIFAEIENRLQDAEKVA